MKKQLIFCLILIVLVSSFISAEDNSSSSQSNSSIISSTCSVPACEYGSSRPTGQFDSNNCSITTCYAGYFLITDKESYQENEVISLKITGEKGKVNVLIMSLDDNTYLIKEGLLVQDSTKVDIRIQDYREIFSKSGDYLIITRAIDEEIIGGVNTNSIKVNVQITSQPVKEKITCILKGSGSGNECYLAGSWTNEDQGTKWCKGTESCEIYFTANKGEKITWKSSCGGYQYTIQDGADEIITFDCTPGETNTSQPVPENNAFRNAYWQCYDGKEFNLGGDSSCKPYGLWKKYATEYCEGRCSAGTEKCGINSFALTTPCYSDYDGEKNSTSTSNEATTSDCEEYAKECKMNNQEACNKWAFNCNQVNGSVTIPVETLICKDSCPLENKCYPFGYRKASNFCSDSGAFIPQLDSDEKCDNNFECSSNVCVSGACISESLMQKIINWFKNLFS